MTNNIEPDHVLVNIAVADGGSPRDGFGLQAILSHNAAFAGRSAAYGSDAEMASDFPDSTCPERRAARAAFAQSPRPTSVLVLKSLVPVTQKYTFGAADAVVGAVYSILAKGQGFSDAVASYTAATGNTTAHVHAALLTALNAVVSKNYLVAFAALPVLTPFAFTCDHTVPHLHAVAHGKVTGDGPIRTSNSGGALPTGLVAATDYWFVRIDADNFQLASSLANALAGIVVATTTNDGTGTQTATPQAGALSPALAMSATGAAPGNWFSFEAGALARFTIAQTHVVSGMSDDLDAILLEDDSWYTLTVLYPSTDYVVDVAAWIEVNARTFVFDVNDSGVLNTAYSFGVTTDVGSQLLALGWKRTMGTFHHAPDQFESAAWMGRFLPADPGKINPKFKTLAGITAQRLTTQQKKNIRDRRMNSFEKIGGAARTWEGTVFSTVNKFFDVTRNVDWLHDEILVDIFGEEVSDIPYTPEGVQRIGGAMHAAFDRAVAQGVSAKDLPQSVVLPAFDSITEEDKGNRVLDPVAGSIELAGFINRVVADVNVIL